MKLDQKTCKIKCFEIKSNLNAIKDKNDKNVKCLKFKLKLKCGRI